MLNKFLHYFCLLFVLILMGACAAHKKCLESNEPVTGSKRYKAAIVERDSLCQLAIALKTDTASLGKTVRDLQQRNDELSQSYQSFKSASGEQVGKLSDELKQRQADLAARQKRLEELENLIKQRDNMLNNILQTVKNALTAFPKDELNVVQKDGKIYVSMSDKLLFKSGSAVVEPRGVDAIKQLSPVLSNYPDLDIVVEGHTDTVPIKTAVFKDNWDLSTYRATSVLRLLKDNGVQIKRLTASGKGEFSPVASNETSEGRAQNRRTEIVLSPNLNPLFQLLGNVK